jgi:Major Facilitator Superfamily
MSTHQLIPAPGPLRRFTLASLVNSVGNGMYLTGSALFFTRVVGLSVGEVASGLAIATAVGLTLMTLFGKLADRYGAKPVYIALLLGQAAAMAGFTLVHDYAGFLVVAAVSAAADRGISGVVGALVHAVSAQEDRAVARAQLRTTSNLGMGGGTLLAGVALAVHTDLAYTALIAGNALLFVAAAAILLRLPVHATAPGRRRGTAAGRRAGPLRDGRYLAVTAVNGLLSVHTGVLNFAVPLWIADHTAAPTWSVSLVMVVNMVLVVVLQVRVSGSSNSVPASARMALLAGGGLAASCAVMTVTPGLGAVLAVLVLLVWVTVFTLGELAQSAAQFYFGFALAPDEAMGAYQSVFALGVGVVRALAPLLLTATVLDRGAAGWLVLGALVGLTGWLTSATATWAARGKATEDVGPEPAGIA